MVPNPSRPQCCVKGVWRVAEFRPEFSRDREEAVDADQTVGKQREPAAARARKRLRKRKREGDRGRQRGRVEEERETGYIHL